LSGQFETKPETFGIAEWQDGTRQAGGQSTSTRRAAPRQAVAADTDSDLTLALARERLDTDLAAGEASAARAASARSRVISPRVELCPNLFWPSRPAKLAQRPPICGKLQRLTDGTRRA